MEEDERLINQAHDLFGQHSIFEIIDIEDRAKAIRTMIEIHGSGVDLATVQQYLDVLDRLRECGGWAESQTAVSGRDISAIQTAVNSKAIL